MKKGFVFIETVITVVIYILLGKITTDVYGKNVSRWYQ